MAGVESPGLVELSHCFFAAEGKNSDVDGDGMTMASRG
jgi:hypothetical protein